MKHFYLYLMVFCVLGLTACSQEELVPLPEEQKVPVTLHLSVADMIDNGLKTRYAFPLDPKVENTIANLWLLQYDQEGNLVDTLMLNNAKMVTAATSHTIHVNLTPRTNSTIVAIANMIGLDKGENWPKDEHYQWQPKFKDMQEKQYDVNLSMTETEEGRAQLQQIFMAGDVVIPVIEENKVMNLNILLARLASRFRISVKGAEGTNFKDVKLQLINLPTKMCIYPIKNLYCEHTDNPEQVVTNEGETLSTALKGPYYFYADEDLAETPEGEPDTNRTIKLKITATEGGKTYMQILKISPTGHNYRNTTYTMELTLKKPASPTRAVKAESVTNENWVEVVYR